MQENKITVISNAHEFMNADSNRTNLKLKRITLAILYISDLKALN